MEFFLHAAYNMDFKRHRCEGKKNKKLKKERKKKIQKDFWAQLRLHIDVPRDSGAGTSNTGFVNISQINPRVDIKRFFVVQFHEVVF